MNISLPKVSWVPLCLTASPSATTDLISVTIGQFALIEFYVNRIIQYAILYAFTQHNFEIYSCYEQFIPFYCKEVFHCMDVLQFIHSPVHRHLGCFQFMAVTNKAATNICVCLYVNICSHFSWIITQEQNGWDIKLDICLTFKEIVNFSKVLVPFLQSSQWCIRGLIALFPHQVCHGQSS